MINLRTAFLCTLALGVVAPADAKPKDRPPVEDEPLWMSDPEGLKLDIVQRFLERGEPVQALALIAAMRNEGIEDPKLDVLQGIALRDQGMTSEAERLLLTAEKKMGRDVRPHAELCILYGGAARLDDAIASCTRATELDQGSAKSWNNLSYVLLGAGRGEDALDAAQHAVDLDGSQARYKNNLGFALAANGRFDDAFDAFRSVGTVADAWYNVGVAYDHHGRPDDARAAWGKALLAEPAHFGARKALSPDVAIAPEVAPAGVPGATVPTPGAPPILVPDPKLPEDSKSSEGDPR